MRTDVTNKAIDAVDDNTCTYYAYFVRISDTGLIAPVAIVEIRLSRTRRIHFRTYTRNNIQRYISANNIIDRCAMILLYSVRRTRRDVGVAVHAGPKGPW